MDRGPAGLQSMGSQRVGHNCVTNFPFSYLQQIKQAYRILYKILYLSRQNYSSLKILSSIEENLDLCVGLRYLAKLIQLCKV